MSGTKPMKQRPVWMSVWVYIGLAALVLVVDGLLLWFDWLAPDQIESFKFDVFKLLFNVAFLTIGGGLIKKAIDEQRALESFRVEVTKALGEVHGTIYVVRRRLRIAPTDVERVDECLVAIMEARTALGSIGHHLRTQRDIGQASVTRNLRDARDYLEEIIDEIVEGRGQGHPDAFTPGPKLEAFLAPEPEPTANTPTPVPSEYRRRFKAPYLRAKLFADSSWDATPAQRATAELPPP